MRFGPVILFFLSLTTLLGPAAAQPAPTSAPLVTRVGVELGADPVSFVGADGRPAGYSVDLLDAIARESGLPIVYSAAPWDDVLARFKTGDVDVLASLVYTAERARFIDYSVPHLLLKGAAFLRREAPPLRADSDLRNLRIAVVPDDFTHEFIKRRGWDRQPVFVRTLPEALQAVAERRADVVLATALVGRKVLRDLRLSGVIASDVPFPDLDFNLHMGVHAGDTARLARLNAGLATIRANGVYDRIHEKWIGPLELSDRRLKDLKLYLVPGLLVVLAVAAAFFWQRRLLHRVRAQAEALRTSEERLKLVLEVGAHGLWDYDFVTDIAERDESTHALIGYTKAELSADPHRWRALIHPEDFKDLKSQAARAAQLGADEMIQHYRIRAKSGEWRWISSRGKIIERAADGSPLRAIGTDTDITALKQQETERAALQAKMLEAQKLESLGVLAGGIAHDFNNLLAVILGNAGLAKLAVSPADTETVLSLTHIETAARRASDLCRQMLAYAGHARHVREPVSLETLVTGTAELLRLSVGKNAALVFDLAPAAPWVEADRSQLQQILMNLVINAAEAIGPGPGTIRLATGHGPVDPARLADAVYRPETVTGDYAWIEVADTGHGMTDETRAKIFEPFFTTKFTGRGLGLAAVLGIVRSHRGIFTLTSAVGRGSTFRIYLPAADPAATLAPAAPPAPALPAATAGAFLVADDEPAVLLMVTKTLEHHGYRTVSARDGREAVQKFAATPGDFFAVIVDLTMPVLDGAAAVREIRALDPAARLLVMSGYGQQETLRQLSDAGRVEFLTKPFSAEELLAAVGRLSPSDPA